MSENSKNSLYDLISDHRTELMGIATIMVLFDHCWIEIFTEIPILYEIEFFLKEYAGTLGVYVFVFLSGFGLPNSYKKSSIIHFYLKRIKRVYPVYLIAILLFVHLYGSGLANLVNQASLLTIFNVNYYPYLWYVPAIMILYLVFPLIYEMYCKEKNKNVFNISFIFICTCLEIFFNYYSYEPTLRLIRIIPIFIIGIISNDIFKKIEFNMLLSFSTLLASLLLFYRIESIISIFHINILSCQIQSSIFAISFSSVYSYVMLKLSNYKCGRLVSNILKGIGSISLEVYCLQNIIDTLYTEKLINVFGAPLTNILFLIIVLFVSFVVKIVIDYLWKSIVRIKEIA